MDTHLRPWLSGKAGQSASSRAACGRWSRCTALGPCAIQLRMSADTRHGQQQIPRGRTVRCLHTRLANAGSVRYATTFLSPMLPAPGQLVGTDLGADHDEQPAHRQWKHFQSGSARASSTFSPYRMNRQSPQNTPCSHANRLTMSARLTHHLKSVLMAAWGSMIIV